MEIWQAILTGGVAAGLIKIIEGVITFRMKRKADKEDSADTTAARVEKCDSAIHRIEAQLTALTEAQRVILRDRIKQLALEHIVAGSISIEDRDTLIEMHRCYHAGLGGNGNLDAVMKSVMSLPINIL